MKRTIKFHTDIVFTGGPCGEYKRVPEFQWHAVIGALAKEHDVIITKIRIHDWLSDSYSKVTIRYKNKEDYQNFINAFMGYFTRYMKDIRVKL